LEGAQLVAHDNVDKSRPYDAMLHLTATKHGFPWSTGASLYKWAQVWLESAMVGESCLLEKAGSKWHANYTLECSFPGTSCSCSCFKIQLFGRLA